MHSCNCPELVFLWTFDQVIFVLADIKQLDRLRAPPVKAIRLVILVLVDGGKSLRIGSGNVS